ncbi:unnamed protein product [Symbiodinium natans]|uniref:Uncharacterized protein n=1 Tax=Symbiodinium natans TaxID=878477 RepID=A0A812M5P6_9DINO|nr:unnamed protein product [Symbiodinium natans]
MSFTWQLADRFAAFALGCLGAPPASSLETVSRAISCKAHQLLAKLEASSASWGTCQRLDLVELRELLCHLEALAKQRAAKQAGYPQSEPGREGVCSAEFKRALGEACGVDADRLPLLLPRDAAGKVDLMGIFRMGSQISAPVLGDEAHCREYVDNASDLPASCADWHAACGLENEVKESSWAEDLGRINKLRAANAFGSEGREVSGDLLVALSRRCGSRRPALGKTALRALMELSRSSQDERAWVARGAEILTCCSAAVLVTKVTARLCDETLHAILRRLVDFSTALALQAVTAAARSQVEAGHPTAVVALLRAAAQVSFGPLEAARCAESAAAAAAVASLLKDILNNRRFAMAFSEARALQRQLSRVVQPESGPEKTT